MTIYEIDTLKQSFKKYALTLVIGICAGLYLSNCAFKPSKSEQLENVSYKATRNEIQTYQPRELTREEKRLQVFESYTRPR